MPSCDELINLLRRKGTINVEVLAAIAVMPRYSFVDPILVFIADDDQALPLSHGQTISQSYIVAR